MLWQLRREGLRAKNGAQLITHHIENSEQSVTLDMLFDKHMELKDVGPFLLHRRPYNLITPTLQAKGWLTRCFRPKIRRTFSTRLTSDFRGKEWVFVCYLNEEK